MDKHDLDRMYRRVPYFTPADPVILDFLNEGDRRLIQSPSCIAANIGYSAAHVRDRLAVLLEKDLVEKIDRGYYRLTELGIALIEEEIEPEELVEEEENSELDDFAENDEDDDVEE